MVVAILVAIPVQIKPVKTYQIGLRAKILFPSYPEKVWLTQGRSVLIGTLVVCQAPGSDSSSSVSTGLTRKILSSRVL